MKCQLDAAEVFNADLIACSTYFGHHYAHHQELKSIIQWLLPVVFRAVAFKLLVWCGAEGYVYGLQEKRPWSEYSASGPRTKTLRCRLLTAMDVTEDECDAYEGTEGELRYSSTHSYPWH